MTNLLDIAFGGVCMLTVIVVSPLTDQYVQKPFLQGQYTTNISRFERVIQINNTVTNFDAYSYSSHLPSRLLLCQEKESTRNMSAKHEEQKYSC